MRWENTAGRCGSVSIVGLQGLTLARFIGIYVGIKVARTSTCVR